MPYYFNSTNLRLIPVEELSGMNFNIPNYQRGYRWTQEQVLDLLNDILEFTKKNPSEDEIYCIQPLVVKRIKQEDILEQVKHAKDINEIVNLIKGSWDVIDGQQRLTTIHLLLTYLGLTSGHQFSINYETRNKEDKGSQHVLENISKLNEKQCSNNIDFYHFKQTYDTIKEWFENPHEKIDKSNFSHILLNRVKFI